MKLICQISMLKSLMFLDLDFFITELTALAYFTHRVSLPLLNFVEVNFQDKLLEIFPKLFKVWRMEKWIPCLITYLCISMYLSNLQHQKQITSFWRPCVREHQNLYCYNVEASMDLAKKLMHLSLQHSWICWAKKIWQASQQIINQVNVCFLFFEKSRNKLAKAKSIRNDMILHQSLQRIPKQKVTQIIKVLAKREEVWDASQKELQKKKIIEKLHKASNQSIYTTTLFQ